MNCFGDTGGSFERSAAARFCCCLRNPVKRVSPVCKPFSLHFFGTELIVAMVAALSICCEFGHPSVFMPRWPNYQRRSAQDREVGGGNPSRGISLRSELRPT